MLYKIMYKNDIMLWNYVSMYKNERILCYEIMFLCIKMKENIWYCFDVFKHVEIFLIYNWKKNKIVKHENSVHVCSVIKKNHVPFK